MPKKHYLLQISLASFIVFLTVVAILAKLYPYFYFDPMVSRLVQGIDLAWFGYLMKAVSSLGEAEWEIGLTAFSAMLLILFVGKKDGLMLIFSTLGAVILAAVIKLLVGRPRPTADLIEQVIETPSSNSFPSGHVMFYMGFFGFLVFLSLLRLKNKWLRVAVASFLVLLIILGGLSRVYLGVHWFSDILGAYLVGFLWLQVSIALFRRT